MEIKELETLIRFHEIGISQYRHLFSISVLYLEEQTIKALQELKELRGENKNGSNKEKSS